MADFNNVSNTNHRKRSVRGIIQIPQNKQSMRANYLFLLRIHRKNDCGSLTLSQTSPAFYVSAEQVF